MALGYGCAPRMDAPSCRGAGERDASDYRSEYVSGEALGAFIHRRFQESFCDGRTAKSHQTQAPRGYQQVLHTATASYRYCPTFYPRQIIPGNQDGSSAGHTKIMSQPSNTTSRSYAFAAKRPHRDVDILGQVLIFFIRTYQMLVSPLLHTAFGATAGCRYELSCSEYAIQSCQTYGFLQGSKASVRRILSCI